MKTADELKTMLYDRIAEVTSGELTQAYEEQVRYEIALLAMILEDDISAEEWEQIEVAM
jgi:hypothetical protein